MRYGNMEKLLKNNFPVGKYCTRVCILYVIVFGWMTHGQETPPYGLSIRERVGLLEDS